MSYGQQPFDPELADNPERRCPVVLLLDRSGSMGGEPLAQLNQGVQVFRDELLNDPVAAKRVEVAIVSFGPVTEETGFAGAESFVAPTLQAGGDTPMGSAIKAGLELLEDRKQQYKAAGVSYYRPWVMLITDGAPTDDWSAAAKLVHDGEAKGAFSFYAIAVRGADLATLGRIAPPGRTPLSLQGLAFTELFRWLSGSVKAVSGSKPGQSVQLASPSGWAAHG